MAGYLQQSWDNVPPRNHLENKRSRGKDEVDRDWLGVDDTNYFNKNEPHAFRGVGSRKLTLDLAPLNMRDRGRLLDPDPNHCCCCFVSQGLGIRESRRGLGHVRLHFERLLRNLHVLREESKGSRWHIRDLLMSEPGRRGSSRDYGLHV
ncbi:hypothetical protein RRG08_022275 [Elysia crispata]|uniref:Uncharacterized protein n=1 Tax=Elysia crispata TaxID=231223 RepID=A0AAE1DKW6_9GAST|nr:hypothetical protein RRG08_022275 [Elysia crispata]